MATAARTNQTLSAERILENARAMAPAIAARSEEIETLRRHRARIFEDAFGGQRLIGPCSCRHTLPSRSSP